jgi:hypothetical protein
MKKAPVPHANLLAFGTSVLRCLQPGAEPAYAAALSGHLATVATDQPPICRLFAAY